MVLNGQTNSEVVTQPRLDEETGGVAVLGEVLEEPGVDPQPRRRVRRLPTKWHDLADFMEHYCVISYSVSFFSRSKQQNRVTFYSKADPK